MSETDAPTRAYAGYGLFVIEERNGRPQEPGAQWRIEAADGRNALGDPAYPRYQTPHATLTAAVDDVRQRLKAEHERLLERAAGCLRQLEQLDAFYAPRPTPGELIAAQRCELVECLRAFKSRGKSPGYRAFHGLTVQLPYMHTKDLFVVSLPEYEPVSPRFLQSDVDCLRGILAEAGYTQVESWNGEDCFSVSFRLRVQEDSVPGTDIDED